MPAALRILLVDDNPDDRLLVMRELRKEFASVRSVEPISQDQFEEALNSGPFDLVVTDYQLRWTTGLDVLRAAKNRAPHCPVVMFTATGSEEIAVSAMKEGLDDYIIKSVVHLIRLRASVRAVLEHTEAKRRAEEVELRLATLLANLKVGVFQCSAEGQLTEVNDAFRRILAIEPEVPPGDRNLRDFFVDARVFDRLIATLARGRSIHDLMTQCRREDGQKIWVSVSQSPGQGTDNLPVLEGLLEDITERVATEQQLRQAETEMAHMARVSTMGEMLASIAHEINQPLNAIANFAVASLKQLETPTEAHLAGVRGWIQEISDQAQRAAAIIRGLRRFVSRQEPRRTACDLHELIHEALQLLESEARHRQIALHCDLADPGPQVLVDRVQIQQVLVNLVRNAFEAMQDTQPPRRIVDVVVHVSDPWVEVNIIDRGHGLPDKEEQDKLFKPFVTTKVSGMGMGLPISSTLVKEHGGRLWASPNEEGATFRFTLPLAWRS